mmetsp:Transcript_14389/g.13877  ORF Transcript_14389/g.13877 Transcript_14389/m.13877 type:complete len:164 (-) Transcript_14389:632-1123(-)
MIVEVGEGHPAIEQVLRESNRFGYKTSTVLTWGKAVREDWDSETANAQASSGDVNDRVLSAVNQLSTQVKSLQQELFGMKIDIETERQRVNQEKLQRVSDRVKERLEDEKNNSLMLGLIADMNKVSVNSNTPPSKKRNCSVMEASNDSIDSGSIEDDLNQESV